ncbi:M20/M25/M40 family metallo-hydrolase [Bacillus timonensis]|nr:M20/M25/M40 family metallo-hydrolase [Bacillus timonensis]
MGKWQSKEQLIDLLSVLVEHASISGSSEEVAIAEYIYMQLRSLPYYEEFPEHVQLHPLEDGRQFVTSLVKKEKAKDTVILLSHFDVVDVEDYGGWKNLAFRPKDLTNEFYRHHEEMPIDVQTDIQNGEWLFGRGTMDMKAGLTLHMSMIERAIGGEFDGNVLLLTVPDEEVNSAGMISAVPVLTELAQKYDLTYTACLNAEPMFSKYPGDPHNYIYTGSIGKVLPCFFCYGKETHVGEPFAGLNANYMASEISKLIELNTDFCEKINGETTPPPTNLMQKDLKEEYSVQIPHSAVTVFNVMAMEKSLKDITDLLLKQAKEAATKIEEYYLKRAEQFAKLEPFIPRKLSVNVFTYEELHELAIQKFGEAEIQRRQNYLLTNRNGLGDRDFSTKLVQDLASLCKEHAPMIVLFYSPPFYPSVCSSEDSLIRYVVQSLIKYADEQFSLPIQEQHYFPGLSDLSFVGMKESEKSIQSLVGNMPLYEKGYSLPIEDLKKLNIPVINVGPVGKDAHQWTERLDLNFTFTKLDKLISFTIHRLLQ